MISRSKARKLGVAPLRRWQAVALLFGGISLTGCDDSPDSAAAPRQVSVPLASFEALYDLTLNRANAASGIEAYEGLLVIRWADTCDGYTSDQHIAADIWNVSGNQIYSEFFSSSWEAQDQSLFRFNMTTKFNEEVSREVVGKASRPTADENGTIVFDKPKENTHDLDPSVLFPSEYTKMMIAAAQAGETVYRANMFDGSDDTIIFDTISIIGAKNNDGKPSAEAENHPLLQGIDYWPVQVGYHPTDKLAELPEFEISMRMYENGIGTDLVLNYGDFALNGKLLELKEITGAGC